MRPWQPPCMRGTPPPTRTGNTLLLREPRLPIAPVGHGGNRRNRTADRHRMKVLLYQLSYITRVAPVEGIEPPLTVLETAALPLYYTGIVYGATGGI